MQDFLSIYIFKNQVLYKKIINITKIEKKNYIIINIYDMAYKFYFIFKFKIKI